MFQRVALNMTSFEVHNGEVSIVGETKGTGPQVVCINGWANSRDVWSDLSENLCKDHQVTIWDLRGHGESGAPPPGNYGREEALKDISAVLDQVGRPCVLVGHSLGGYLSLAYALENPDEVAALVLVAAGPGFRKAEAREEWNKSVRQAAKNLDLAQGAEELSMHVDSYVIDHLDDIRAPTFLVLGERDKRFAASAAVFKKYLDVKETLVVPDVGHMVHVKASDEVAQAVRNFISDLDL